MEELVINGISIKPGSTTHLELPVADLYTGTEMQMPVYVTRARKPGPCVFACAAIHGDELNGIEIIRRLIHTKSFKLTAGTFIAVPMVNVYGVLSQSRYLPDRRDLNRSFPGSPKGALAGRVADRFLNEIVLKCDYGIDLHTGAIHRSNLPQVRADLTDPDTRALAHAFGVPVLLNAELREGSLREAAVKSGVKVLLYEAGQALRFDELAIKAGVRGIHNVLSHLNMLPPKKATRRPKVEPFEARKSAWIRAEDSGIVRVYKNLGDQVCTGDLLAEIGTPFGETVVAVRADRDGIIIGKQNIPLVQEGEAMFHLAFFNEADEDVAEHIEKMQDTLLADGIVPPIGDEPL
ncbi:succinylglutamate desuccinylase/aspartoacylase family protein [Teredinibacter turnerae]|uniref:succinylglutamate desuccinylase/aspartoacylase family protein n=1 Tax=Teredinibacter turnerae TaxID=2426 RepID=UPI00037039B6|nr:succinylglutamate desuccinylase/aspartoacylase family protein [Teredinibacter turnerae]